MTDKVAVWSYASR